MGIKAKEVLKNKFWVLVDKEDRVGEMESTDQGYKLQFDSKPGMTCKSLAEISRQIPEFRVVRLKQQQPDEEKMCMGYPAKTKVHSPLWDMGLRVPVYLNAKNSKSWYAAGYYLVKFHRTWKTKFCPKIIALQRYEFRGPFKTQEQLLEVVE
tara:strand:+ start:7341 stop:7796 length:456 start_codon:yes stop_codon:yes gene_type:complete